MSDYTLAVNWSGKDALADSDAAKVISGADFNTEFTTVQTAINSKADLNGSSSEDFAMDNGTMAGNVTAPTQTAGNNTTRLATTAFVTTAVAALDAAAINAIVYPVGSIYFQVAVATNPATLLGMGTWVAYAEGRALVGKAGSGTFDTLNETMGAETHTLSTGEITSHTHGIPRGQDNGAIHAMGVETEESSINYATSQATGGGGAHNNIQPSIVVYMWKRTA